MSITNSQNIRYIHTNTFFKLELKKFGVIPRKMNDRDQNCRIFYKIIILFFSSASNVLFCETNSLKTQRTFLQ